MSDSVWENTLNFDINQDYDDTTTVRPETGSEDSHQFKRDELLRLSKFYIQKAGWDLGRFDVADIRMETVESIVVARIRYRTAEPVFGQAVNLETSLTPTGSLLGLAVNYNPQTASGNGLSNLWEMVRAACIFLFGIAVIIIFYFRIRARVIDTKSALVISILAGFIVPAIIFLNEVNETDLFDEGSSWVDIFGLLLSMGMTGALGAVGFFIVSAVGDSITRQHWPEKLDCYDYLRQGMFFNKPVGETLVRGSLSPLSWLVFGLCCCGFSRTYILKPPSHFLSMRLSGLRCM
ncbi:MAG: hypothetical protein U5K69_28990 [Balneolaceae bacterium]|nr:hypothetical protein [Balneolaceae bacterium]